MQTSFQSWPPWFYVIRQSNCKHCCQASSPPPDLPMEVKGSDGDLGKVLERLLAGWGSVETMVAAGLIKPVRKWDKNSSCNSSSDGKGAEITRLSLLIWILSLNDCKLEDQALIELNPEAETWEAMLTNAFARSPESQAGSFAEDRKFSILKLFFLFVPPALVVGTFLPQYNRHGIW